MSLKVFGCSDDLIEIESDGLFGKAEFSAGYEDETSTLFFSDGTVLDIIYGKKDAGIWSIDIRKVGSLFKEIEICMDEDDIPYSDIVTFEDGITWVFASDNAEEITGDGREDTASSPN